MINEFDQRMENRLKGYRNMPLTKAVMDSIMIEVWEELNLMLVEKENAPIGWEEFMEYC